VNNETNNRYNQERMEAEIGRMKDLKAEIKRLTDAISAYQGELRVQKGVPSSSSNRAAMKRAALDAKRAITKTMSTRG
jgi:hypothetical protein